MTPDDTNPGVEKAPQATFSNELDDFDPGRSVAHLADHRSPIESRSAEQL
jgi:hypothetical protein